MNREEVLYLTPYLFSLILSAGVFIYTWQHRYMRGARTYSWFVAGQTLTILGFIFELISPNLQTKIMWDKFQWLTDSFLVIIPFLFFSVEFSEQKLRHPRLIWGYWLGLPFLFTVLLITDNVHHLLYPNPHLSSDYPFPDLQYTFTGVVYLYAFLYVYGANFYSIGLLVKRAIQPHNPYRFQFWTIIIGFLIPLVLSTFALADIRITPQRDIGPFSFAIANMIVAWGLFRYKLFDIVPIAREHIVEDMIDPVVVLDTNNRIVDINKATLSFLNKQAPEVIGRPLDQVFANWLDIVSEFDSGDINGRQVTIEKEETSFFFDLNVSPIYNNRRQLVGRIIVARDATRHKTLEIGYRTLSQELEQRVIKRTEELRQTAERYRAVVENQTEFIVRWNLDGMRTFVNEAYCHYFNLTPEEALSSTFMPLVAEEDRRGVEAKIARLTSGEVRSETEIHRVIRPDGSIGWQEWTDQAIFDENGDIVEFQSVGRDITARKQAEDQIRKAEAQFRTLVEKIPPIVYTSAVDQHIGVTYISPRINMLGYSQEEWIADPELWLRQIHPDDQKKVLADIQKGAEPGASFKSEYRLIARDGSVRWFLDEAIDVLDDNGTPSFRQGLMLDISERKEAEEIIINQLAFDELLTGILTEFATCSYNEVDTSIIDALHATAKFFGGDFADIFQISEDKRTWQSTHYWVDKNIQQANQPALSIPVGTLKWSEDKLSKGESIRINSLDEYPPDASQDRQFSENEGIKSLMSVPIRGAEQSMTGIIDVISYAKQIKYTDNDVTHLKLIGDTIANLLERKRAETALLKSEEKHRLLFESANDSIVILKENRFVDCNSKALEMFNCRREDMIGSNPFYFSPPVQPDGRNSQEKATKKIQAALQGVPQFFEWQHCRLDKTPFDAEVSLNLLKLDDGDYIQGIIRDVTKRKQAEDALRKSEERFAKAFQSSPIIVALTRMNDGTILEVNESFELAFGFSRDQVIGKTTGELELWVRDKDREHLRKALVANKPVRNEELQFRTKSGEILTSLYSAELIELGGEQCIISTVEDITERKKAEERILRLNRLYATISQINQTIVHARNRNVLFKEICHVAIDYGQFRMSWIGLVDETSEQIEPVVFAGEEQGYLTGTRLKYKDEVLGKGPTGTAIREGHCVICQDIATDPGMSPWRERALTRGYRSSAAVPFREHGRVIGAMTVYASEPHGFDTDDEDLLEQIGQNISFAIDSIDHEAERRRAEKGLAEAYDTTLEGWAKALELRDKETEGHSRRVTETTLTVARAMGFSEDELVHIRRGSILHDIGKMGIPDDILRKNGPLTDEEREVVVKHPTTAYNLLKPIAYLKQALEIPYCHHEKWDGSGYPRGLKGEEIPLAARIFAVVDVWDALRSDRPYRDAWSQEKVAQYLTNESGKHFDPKVVSVFLQMVEKGEI